MIYIKTDSALNALRRLGVELNEAQVAKVTSRAINKTLEKGRTQARREVKRVYNITQRYLDGINYRRSTPVTVTGMLVATQKPIPLDAFAPREELGSGMRKITRRGELKEKTYKREKKNAELGVTVEIFKGHRQLIPFAFMIPGGAVRVFARGLYKEGRSYGFVKRVHRVNSNGNDLPVSPLITVSEFGTILNPKVMGIINANMKNDYPVQFERQVNFMLSTLENGA